MSKYQITLTPVDKFFFGGDMTFAVSGRQSEYEKFVSYIIESSMMPQQTSLLGMLRFLLLRNAGEDIFTDNRIVDKQRAKELIGDRSFCVNDVAHEANDYKSIKNIGHVRIRRIVNDQVTDLEFKPLFKDLDFDKVALGSYNLHDVSIPLLSNDEYDAKKGLSVKLTDGIKDYELEEVFVKDRHVGISRDIKTGIVDDSALFKQISYRFKNKEASYCFVFDAEVDDHVHLEDNKVQIVSVGGDNSQFVIEISKEVKSNEHLRANDNIVWLLSPTFLTRSEAMKAQFAVTRLMPFRFLRSVMDDVKSYHILHGQLTRSERYELYAPGSVFYFKGKAEKDEFVKQIMNKREFRQIGYNEFK